MSFESSPSSSKKQKLSDLDESVCGYVHDVSPIKTSLRNTRYFNAKIQTEQDEFHHAVVFSPEKHAEFSEAANNSTPIKLDKIVKAVSHRTGSGFDIRCNRMSSLQVVSELSFPPKNQMDDGDITIGYIKKEVAPFQHIKYLFAKVDYIDVTPKVVNIRGGDVEMRSDVIADKTDSITLTVWDKQIGIVKAGESYKFTNLSIRQYAGSKQLTTTRETLITQIEDIGETSQPDNLTENQCKEVVGTIRAINLVQKKICTLCHKNQASFDKTQKFNKCTVCAMLQNSSDFQNSWQGNIIVKSDDQHKFGLTTGVINKFLKSENLELNTAQEIKLHLMEGQTFSFEFTQDFVLTSLCPITEPTTDTSSDDSVM